MGAAVGAGAFRRANDLPLIEPYYGEDQAQEQRARNQDEVDQRNGKRNYRQGAAGGESNPRSPNSLAGSEILHHQLGLGGAGAESFERHLERLGSHPNVLLAVALRQRVMSQYIWDAIQIAGDSTVVASAHRCKESGPPGEGAR
jgi:hypothetical protein